MIQRLARTFYTGPVWQVARALLGTRLVYQSAAGEISGMITETEAYDGLCDAASHAFPNRRTNRTEILFHLGGHVYMFMIYGLHHCFNIVTGEAGQPQGVLVRALQPLTGLAAMGENASSAKHKNICGGPGKLCRAFGLTRQHNGLDLCDPASPLYIEPYKTISPEAVKTAPRINIAYAKEDQYLPWRFYIA